MNTQNIEKKVLESAGAEAEKLVREAEEAARKRMAAAEAESERRSAQAVEETRTTLEQKLHQKTTSEKAANKLKLLTHKAAILEEVFARAVDQFIGDRTGDYRKWLSAQLQSVAGEKGTIVAAREDRPVILELLSDLKKADGLSIAEDSLPLCGGFVLKGEKVDLDLSLDTRLDELKAQLLPELAERAFGSGAHSQGKQ